MPNRKQTTKVIRRRRKGFIDHDVHVRVNTVPTPSADTPSPHTKEPFEVDEHRTPGPSRAGFEIHSLDVNDRASTQTQQPIEPVPPSTAREAGNREEPIDEEWVRAYFIGEAVKGGLSYEDAVRHWEELDPDKELHSDLKNALANRHGSENRDRSKGMRERP